MTTKEKVLALALLLPAALPAQERPAPPRVASAVETSILELDVVVTDRDGRRVTGLQAADFEVRIAGKATAIANFFKRRPAPAAALPGVEAGAPAPAPAPDAAQTALTASRPPRHVVLFVDRLHLIEKWKADATFDGLRTVLRQTVVAPGDDAMIVTWNRSVGLVVPFTSDVAAIERVLASEEKLSRRPLEDMTLRQLEDEAAWFRTLPTTSVSSGVEVSRRAAAAEAYAQMRAKANALKAVFSTLGGLPGRKIVVLASHRFSDLAGLEFFLTGPVAYGDIPSDAREFNAHGIVESVAEAANANGVTLYTMFPPGWPDEAQVVHADAASSSNPRINDPVEGARGDMIVMNEAAALEPVALKTGGAFALGYKEAPTLGLRIAADLDSAYSLGVEAPGGKAGKTLSVAVKTKDRALKVRTRRTVVEKTPEERVRDRVLSNLFRPERESRLPVALAASNAETKKGKTAVSLTLSVPVARLVRAPSERGESGGFSVYVASAAADGSFSDVTRQRQPFDVPRADAARADAGHFTYELPVVVSSDEARISVGVWDEVGREAGFLVVDVAGGKVTLRR
jgi:VWFA-related protein